MGGRGEANQRRDWERTRAGRQFEKKRRLAVPGPAQGLPWSYDQSGPGRHSEPGGRWTAVGRAASTFSVILAKPASSATFDILPDGKNVMFDRRSPPFA